MKQIKLELKAGIPSDPIENVVGFQNKSQLHRVWFTINDSFDYDTAFWTCPGEKETGLGIETYIFQSKVDLKITIGVES